MGWVRGPWLKLPDGLDEWFALVRVPDEGEPEVDRYYTDRPADLKREIEGLRTELARARAAIEWHYREDRFSTWRR